MKACSDWWWCVCVHGVLMVWLCVCVMWDEVWEVFLDLHPSRISIKAATGLHVCGSLRVEGRKWKTGRRKGTKEGGQDGGKRRGGGGRGRGDWEEDALCMHYEHLQKHNDMSTVNTSLLRSLSMANHLVPSLVSRPFSPSQNSLGTRLPSPRSSLPEYSTSVFRWSWRSGTLYDDIKWLGPTSLQLSSHGTAHQSPGQQWSTLMVNHAVVVQIMYLRRATPTQPQEVCALNGD